MTQAYASLEDASGLRLAADLAMLGEVPNPRWPMLAMPCISPSGAMKSTPPTKRHDNQGPNAPKFRTIYLRVPTTDHVALVIGKNGHKINSIRESTNTHIEPPRRNKEPIFMISGRAEDVRKAKYDIVRIAYHFSVLRAARAEGYVTEEVLVPRCSVGYLMGLKGSMIRNIQHHTLTEIVALHLNDRGPQTTFVVTGQPWRVSVARRIIDVCSATAVTARWRALRASRAQAQALREF